MNSPDNPSQPQPNEPALPNTPAGGSANIPPPGTPRPRRKRWWLRVMLVLLLLIVLLVAFAPFLAGTAPVRSIVVSQINNSLNGAVAIDDYSIGWTGGIRANGIRVYDDQKNLVLEVPRIDTRLSLLGAARGNLDIGETVIDVRLGRITVDENGKSNLDNLTKADPSKTDKGASSGDSNTPIELPNVKGKLTVNLLGGGTISVAGMPEIRTEPGTVALDMSDLGTKPIANDVKLSYRVGDASPSVVHLNGTVHAARNGKLDLAALRTDLTAQQKVELANVDLGALTPLLMKAMGPEARVGGIASGAVNANLQGITGVSADGELQVANLVFAGGGLHDVLRVEKVAVPIQIVRTERDAHTTLIDIRMLKVQTTLPGGKPLVGVDVTGQVVEQALLNLTAGKAPGADGSITISTTVPDFAALAAALPQTLKLAQDVTVNGGSLTQQATLLLTNDRVTITQRTDVAASGLRAGKPIAFQPVHLELNAVAIPTGKPIPDIRDMKLAFTSAFATINGGGETLAKLAVNGNVDLSKLRSEVAQFSDLGDTQLAGIVDFAVKTDGDVTSDSAPIALSASAQLNKVRVSGATTQLTQPIDLDRAVLTTNAGLRRSAGAVSGLQGATVTLRAGEESAPLIDLSAGADVDLSKPGTVRVPRFELSKLAVNDLSAVQKQYGALVPALAQQQITINSGALYANVSGSFDGEMLALDPARPLAFSMPNVVVSKSGHQVLGREDITGRIAGTVKLGEALAVNLADLSVTSKSGLFSISRGGEAPITATIASKTGGIAGNGQLAYSADLKRLSDLARAFGGGTAAAAPDAPGQLRSGRIEGTLALAQAGETKVDLLAKVLNLSVSGREKPIENETVNIALSATAPADLSGVNVSKATMESRFATARVSDARLQLGGVWELVQSAGVDVDVPDLPAALNLLTALSPVQNASANEPAISDQPSLTVARPVYMQSAPPRETRAQQREREQTERSAGKGTPTAAREQASGSVAPAPPPIEIIGGSAIVKLNVTRDSSAKRTNVSISQMRLSGLSLARGEKRFSFKEDVALKLSAAVVAADDPALALGEQVRSVAVSELSGTLGGVATLAAPDGLNVTGPLSKPAANGTIRLDGTIDAAAPLLALLQYSDALPYSGEYALVQKISSVQADDGLVANLEGSLAMPRFRVMQDGVPAFEDSIEMKNNVGAYLDRKAATIRTLTIAMPRSNALAVDVAGRVNNWDANRQIRDAKIAYKGNWGELWKIVYPMLGAETRKQYEKTKVAGTFDNSITVGGAFPVKSTVYESMRSLEVQGSLPKIELLDLPQGVTAQMIDLPFEVKKGVLTLLPGKIGERPPTPEDSNDGRANGPGLAGLLGGGDRNRRRAADERSAEASSRKGTAPKAAAELKPENGFANTGELNLAGITVDLTSPNLSVSVPKDKVILRSVRLNPVLADSLGKTGAILLVGSSTAEGLVSLRVAECRNVPIGDLASRDRHARATLVLSVDDLNLTGIFPNLLAQALGTEGIRGRITESPITLSGGLARTNLTVMIDKAVKDPRTGKEVLQGQSLGFSGGLDLGSLRLQDFAVNIAPELLLRDIRKIAPNGAVIPLTGTATAPQLDLQKFLIENAGKGLIPGLIGGGGAGDKERGATGKGGKQGEQPPPSLEDILKGLGKPKK